MNPTPRPKDNKLTPRLAPPAKYSLEWQNSEPLFPPGPNPGAHLQRELLCKRELALVLGVSERTIENWLAAKLIPRLRLSPRLTRFSLPRVLVALNRYEIREVGAI